MGEVFGSKELYDVTLKAIQPFSTPDFNFAGGEVVAAFDHIMVASFDEIKSFHEATGGYDNASLVQWSTTREMHFDFSQGVFSKTHLALMGNSYLGKSKHSILVPIKEELESDENGQVSLKYIPKELFVYNLKTNERIIDFEKEDNIIRINSPYTEVLVRYYYEYMEESTFIKVGSRFVRGYLKLEGKTRLKDDITGRYITGIITIPRIKLMSDLSMRLGEDAHPMVANFSGVGYPVGERDNKAVCTISILDRDIDSDF